MITSLSISDLPKTDVGGKVAFSNGAYHTYRFPRCYRVVWSNTSYKCIRTAQGGQWQESKDWARDALCHGYGKHDQPHMRIITK